MNYLIHSIGREIMPRKPIPRLFPKVGEWKGEPERVEIKGAIALTSLDAGEPTMGVSNVTYGVEASHVFAVGDEVECLPIDLPNWKSAGTQSQVGKRLRISNVKIKVFDEYCVSLNGGIAWPLRLIRAANAPVEEPQEKDGWRFKGNWETSIPGRRCVWWSRGERGVFKYPDCHWENEFNDSYPDWPTLKRAIKEETKCK